MRLDHPSEQDLQRFLRGELTPAEVRAVVRHLLTGCPECREVTRRLWSLGDRVPLDPRGKSNVSGRKTLTTSHEAAAQEGLRTAALELKRVRERLKRIVDALPLSAQEQDPEDLNQEPDVTTEIRRVALCVIKDSLDPAIADLTAASVYRPRLSADA